MQTRNIWAASLAGLAAAAGCAALNNMTNPPHPLTDQERGWYWSRGGDDLVHDVETVRATVGHKDALESLCLDAYGRAREHEREHSDESALTDYANCLKFCAQNDREDLAALASKYQHACQTSSHALKDRFFMASLRKDIDKARQAPDAYTFARYEPAIKRNFDIAASNLDDGHPGLKALRGEYDGLLHERARDLDSVRAFLERADVRELDAKIATLQAEVASANELYRVTGDLAHRQLAELKAREIEPLQQRWTDKAIASGIVASSGK
jgi:hypothetical protein